MKFALLLVMEFDYLVIGAGVAGLSFTALMEKKLAQNASTPGQKIALLESHHLVGGCASYFERDGFLFDAGATTLSGLLPGRPLDLLIKELNLNIDLKKIDPGLIFLFPDKIINRFSDEEKWREELSKNFPKISHNDFWNKIEKINKLGWELSGNQHELPLRSKSDLLKLISFKNLKAIKALPLLFKSVEKSLGTESSHNKEYRALINELLFITAQNKMDDTPLLMGAMGLSYPNDTYYAMGGMKALCLALQEKCSHLFLRHKVIEIKKIPNGFLVTTDKRTFTTKKIISSLPEWNNAALLKDEVSKVNKEEKNCWSAFMLYLTIPKNEKRSGLYYQIHTDPIPFCDSKSFFVSLSHPQDQLRSIFERQTVTISCHTKPSLWENLESEEYKRRKKIVQDFILTHLCEHFDLKKDELKNIYSGSPKTFVRYTNRHRGLVGGIPHSLKRNPLSYALAFSSIENFYQIGDTQFPGQGIAAVILGAQNLIRFLEP